MTTNVRVPLDDNNSIKLDTLLAFAYQVAGFTSSFAMKNDPSLVFPDVFNLSELKTGIANIIQEFDFTA